jgi:hypothetical protein
MSPPGRTPKEWITSGAMKRADSLESLARQRGIDTGGLLKIWARGPASPRRRCSDVAADHASSVGRAT